MPVQFKDYYEILGLPRTASTDEIKKAFRKLARIHHPDVAKNKVTGEAKFKEINEAYEVLNNAEKRAQYDQLGTGYQHGADFSGAPRGTRRGGFQPQDGGAPFEFTGTGFSDFFETFFSGRQNGGDPFGRSSSYGEEPAHAARGHDAEADIMVTLEEAFRGATRQITVRRSTAKQTYQVKIPAGVREGKRIRLSGQGGAGQAGGSAGDLFLRVRLASHPDFRVEDSDLHYELDLAPWEAVLGAKVTIPTLDGPAALRVKAGSQNGTSVRLRGMGLPRDKGSRGDLFATVMVKIPASVTAEERALWEKLAAGSKFQPRD